MVLTEIKLRTTGSENGQRHKDVIKWALTRRRSESVDQNG